MAIKLRLWTGPTQVNEYADRLERGGFDVRVRGTEHVHVAVDVEHVNQAEEKAKLALGFTPRIVSWSHEPGSENQTLKEAPCPTRC